MTDLPEVAVVTVAYSANMDLLARQSASLVADPAIREWVVVANGNGHLIRAALAQFARVPRLIEIESNTGSAVGFGSGIAAALSEPGNRYLLLLDEDNLPETDTVTRLLAALRGEETSRGAAGRVAIAAHRPHLYASQAARGIDVRPWDSSIGSHMADLPAKVFRRLLPRALPPSARVSLKTSAYGGLLAPRALLESVGLPLPELVLYADDTEYTLRMTGGGATILLDTDIALADMDAPEPWTRTTLFSLTQVLGQPVDFRFYYGARNEAWLDAHRLARHRVVYRLNRAFARLVLRLYARTDEQRARLALFVAAAAEGEAGHLGPNPHYPLPKVR